MKDEDIEKKIEDLQNKYFMSSNEHTRNQLVDLLDIFQSELTERQQIKYAKEILENTNSELYDLINIK